MAYFKEHEEPEQDFRPAFQHSEEVWDEEDPQEDAQYYAPDEESLPMEDTDALWETQTKEAKRMRRQVRLRVLFGLSDFLGVIIGTVVILILIALLISLVTWLQSDLDRTFTFFMKRI